MTFVDCVTNKKLKFIDKTKTKEIKEAPRIIARVPDWGFINPTNMAELNEIISNRATRQTLTTSTRYEVNLLLNTERGYYNLQLRLSEELSLGSRNRIITHLTTISPFMGILSFRFFSNQELAEQSSMLSGNSALAFTNFVEGEERENTNKLLALENAVTILLEEQEDHSYFEDEESG